MSDAERLDRAIERLLADRSPRAETSDLTDEEQAMLRMAQLIRGSRPIAPSRNFTDRLHGRLFPRTGRRMSRRSAFMSGLAAIAATALGAFGIDRLTESTGPRTAGGKWFRVASTADVPPGAVHAFTAGPVQGFLINQAGEYRALSRICTHMACALKFQQSEQSFECPCHGAEFNMFGHMIAGPGGYGVNDRSSLPPLPRLHVRVKGESVEVLTV